MIKRWLVGAKRILKNIGKSDMGIIQLLLGLRWALFKEVQ